MAHVLEALQSPGRAGNPARIEELERLLAQKERQLHESEQRYRELHHRVMNDLAGLDMHQHSQWQTVGQPESCSQCIARLDATIELYGLLDKLGPGRRSKIRVASYLRKVAQTLQRAFAGNLKIETSLNPLASLSRERASLIGLIFHEAIANALKYAFPHGSQGTVHASLRETDSGYELVVSDDGIGFDPATAKRGVGMQVMRHLAQQLNGAMHYAKVPRGTELHLSFPA
jgi:two-component sensor histidine kinase